VANSSLTREEYIEQLKKEKELATAALNRQNPVHQNLMQELTGNIDV
jgi:hypothetical protein